MAFDADDSARDASEIAHIASGQMESILAWPGKVGSTLSCRKVDGWRRELYGVEIEELHLGIII